VSAVSLQSEDLADLASLAKDLNFDDAERRSALLENGSRDFNAVPGSGKTSLLAAKLLLLAKRWPHARRGICVLSHTNVARDEITRRLAQSPDGASLLGYPHYIGTIHGFVNQFFAMPLLRSLNMKVDVIDDAVFAEKALSLLQQAQFYKLRFFLNTQQNADEIPTSLYYRTAELELQVERGKLPGATTNSHQSLAKLKQMLVDRGVFRHRDMFAYADLALKTCPHLLDVVHRRFPMVFIDEMQDTSWDQESFLNRIFDGKVVMQRFGDVDQKILSDESDFGTPSFPRDGYGRISTSKRFGDAIAHAVGSVRMSGDTVVGEAVQAQPPILLLYGAAHATKVVEHFGRLVVERLGNVSGDPRPVRAMCARKSGDAQVAPGRHMCDYWSAYAGGGASEVVRSSSFWSLVGDAGKTLRATTLADRVSDVRRALLLVLRAAGSPLAQDVRDARGLPRAAREAAPKGQIERLTRQLALRGAEAYAAPRAKLLELMFGALKPYLPTNLTLQGFTSLDVFQEQVSSPSPVASQAAAKCDVQHQGTGLQIGLGTVALMKGETHLASLVLESYGGPKGMSKKFDVTLGLEYIAGKPIKALAKLSPLQKAQMRNLYVAMSRPSTLLCLAANESRVSQAMRDLLAAKGWHIEAVV
jgi:hypothetical protein